MNASISFGDGGRPIRSARGDGAARIYPWAEGTAFSFQARQDEVVDRVLHPASVLHPNLWPDMPRTPVRLIRRARSHPPLPDLLCSGFSVFESGGGMTSSGSVVRIRRSAAVLRLARTIGVLPLCRREASSFNQAELAPVAASSGAVAVKHASERIG
jgi:hypothetical protein